MTRARSLPVRRGAVFLLVTFVALLMSPSFGTGTLSIDVFRDVSGIFMLAAPLAVALGLGMILGEFDLSVVATYALGGMIAAKLGGSIPGAIVVALLAGAAAGLIQGYLIARLDVNAVPVTLGGYLVIWGIVNLIGGGKPAAFDNIDVTLWLTDSALGVFTPGALIVLVVMAVLDWMLFGTRLGRSIRAVGGGKRASRIAGIHVLRVRCTVFALAGVIAAAGGVLQAYSTANAAPDVPFDPLIQAVIAVVIGGVAISGGEGSVAAIGTGVLGLAFLNTALAVMGVDPSVSNIMTGTILAVVAIVSPPRFRDAVRVRAQAVLRRSEPRVDPAA